MKFVPILAVAALASFPLLCAPALASNADRAVELYASALRRLAVGSHEQRQFARTELEDAAKLDPANHDITLALGNVYLEFDMLQRALDVADRVAAADSANARARLLQGRVWRRHWLLEADDRIRDRAIVCFAHGARAAPGEYECWAALVPLLVDADELEPAKSAAAFAVRAAPARPEVLVLLASVAQRTGDVASADKLFHTAIPRLPALLRRRYTDLSPLLPPGMVEPYAAMPAVARGHYEQEFWRAADPDPVTEENEARLEFWARVTQAEMLYGEAQRPGEWDLRAQYYVRYGKPEAVVVNPINIGHPAEPGDALGWLYPSLGMAVGMSSTNAVFGFSAPVSSDQAWAQPYRDSLENREDVDAVQHGWAVFHRLPPGVEVLDARLAVAHFESERGPSVLAEAEAGGGPGSHITAEWTILDSTLTPLLREETSMAPSACLPEAARSAGFTKALPPGRYRVCVHATDEDGRLGVLRRDVFVPGSVAGLALSDLVVTCSAPELSIVPGSGVRLEPATGLCPANEGRLNAYFEIYGLSPNEAGDSRFEYDCVVRSVAVDRRGWLSRLFSPTAGPAIEMSRRETTHGAMRRQFLTVPVEGLPAGRYEIDVRVRDLLTGAESNVTAQFVRG